MATTPQDIQKFYKIAATKDFSRDFLFRVKQLNLFGSGSLQPDDLVYAKAAALPGRAIGNVAVPYMGLPFNVPGSVTYPGSDAYNLTFFLDRDSTLREYFEIASRNLFNDQSSTGAYQTPNSDSYIELTQINKRLDEISTYKLEGASIRTINNIEYSMSAGIGATVDISVTLAYHFYTTDRTSKIVADSANIR
jgi:hypothetical protein